jgi:hypothetical protein
MRVLGYSLSIKHHILAHFCHMLFTLKELTILIAKMMMKFQPGANVKKLFRAVVNEFL